jgi:hypothetical protein
MKAAIRSGGRVPRALEGIARPLIRFLGAAINHLAILVNRLFTSPVGKSPVDAE